MKKFLLISAVALAPVAAQAESVVFKPYVGVDLQRTNVEYNNNYDIGGGFALDGEALLEDSLNGFNVHVGSRFHENFGLELGYYRTQDEDKSVASGSTVGPGTVATADFTTSVQIQGITLDALGYLPVADMLDLIGTAGIGWNKAEVSLTVPGVGTGSVDESEFGFRAGAGAQVNVTENFGVRGLARYQSADFDDVADNAWTYSLGVNYSF